MSRHSSDYTNYYLVNSWDSLINIPKHIIFVVD